MHSFLPGPGDLVVRSRSPSERAPGSKPDSTEDPQCLKARRNLTWDKRGKCQLRSCPCYLTTVQEYKMRKPWNCFKTGRQYN
ncbi:hypothetical protein AVEN_9510-1 [Araneus ventricosus]|uniref:Uncharacterized protein n=1 Tax=Araneus ventricosus TaxID=182803 RepID=A0A4Y2Q5U7_ARAVE|nr:hypothetical protein AVEN_9510-1 [Araneus ventricosus]